MIVHSMWGKKGHSCKQLKETKFSVSIFYLTVRKGKADDFKSVNPRLRFTDKNASNKNHLGEGDGNRSQGKDIATKEYRTLGPSIPLIRAAKI